MTQPSQPLDVSVSLDMVEAMAELQERFDAARREAELAREQIRRLSEQADAQPGVGIANREALIRRMHLVGERSGTPPLEHTIACLTLANGSQIRQRFGLAAIDAAMTVIGEELSAAVRASDTVASLGGYDFGVLLTLTGDRAAALKAAQLAALVRRRHLASHAAIAFDMRWGAAPFAPGDNPRRALADADLDLLRRQGTPPTATAPREPS